MISGFMKSTTSMFRIAPDAERFWPELHEKFADLWRVAFYVISFVLLGYTWLTVSSLHSSLSEQDIQNIRR
jgi:hypothetical protein